MKKTQLLKRFDSFVYSIKPNEKIAVLHHTDPDGVCSAVIISKAIEKISGIKPILLHQGHGKIQVEEKTIKKLKKMKIKKFISTDLSIDQKPEGIERISEFAQALVLDHHKPYSAVSSKKALLIKSQFMKKIDGSKYPCSKLAFDLFSRITDLREEKWLACVGIIGDFSLEKWKGFVGEEAKKWKKTEKEGIIFFTELKDLFFAVETVHFSELDSFKNFLLKISSPTQLKKSHYWKYKKEMQGEIKKWVGKAKTNAEIFPEKQLVFYFVKPKHQIKAPLANLLSQEVWPKMTLILMQDSGKGEIDLSARRQDGKAKMNNLLESAVKGLKKARAGGHFPAAGGSIQKKDLQRFKKAVLAQL